MLNHLAVSVAFKREKQMLDVLPTADLARPPAILKLPGSVRYGSVGARI
jgi:hypothetical protein